MAIPPDITVFKDLEHGPGMTGIRNEIGVHDIEEAPFDKVRNVGVPVSRQPNLPSRLGGPWTEEGRQFLSNRFRRPSPVSPSKEVLNAAKLAPDCTPPCGFNDFSRVVEFFVKKISPDVRKPGEVYLSTDIFFLQSSTCKVVENVFPYGFSLTQDDRIGVFQGFLWQSRYMESAQDHFCPLKPQTIGDAINIRHVVG